MGTTYSRPFEYALHFTIPGEDLVLMPPRLNVISLALVSRALSILFAWLSQRCLHAAQIWDSGLPPQQKPMRLNSPTYLTRDEAVTIGSLHSPETWTGSTDCSCGR